MSRFDWHIGQATTIAPAPARAAPATILPLIRATRSVRVTEKAAPQHSVLKFQSSASAPAAAISRSMDMGSSGRSKATTLGGRTSRQP